MQGKLSEDRNAIEMDVEIRKAIQPAVDVIENATVLLEEGSDDDIRNAITSFITAVKNVEKVLKNPCATFQLRCPSNEVDMYGFLTLVEEKDGYGIYCVRNGDAVSRKYVIPNGYLVPHLHDGIEVWEGDPLYGPYQERSES